jgi:heme-degrading monooxygenase HmoA
MPTLLVLPWRWTGQPRPDHALVFASRFDADSVRTAPGALGVTIRAHPIGGHYYTQSLWKDEPSLLAFTRSPAHHRAAAALTRRGPVQGVLISRDANPARRDNWRDTLHWLASVESGPYRRGGSPS